MKPISYSAQTVSEARNRIIKYRPFPDSAIREMGQQLQNQSWHEIYSSKCPEMKAIKFEEIIMQMVNFHFPEKSFKVKKNDKPWVDAHLLRIDRQRKREYNKNKRSEKWLKLNEQFLERADRLKKEYYKNRVEDLKTSNTSQWYSKLKRMSSLDQTKEDEIEVEDLIGSSNQSQAEKIADQFALVSSLYEPLNLNDINIPTDGKSKPLPLFEPYQIYMKI